MPPNCLLASREALAGGGRVPTAAAAPLRVLHLMASLSPKCGGPTEAGLGMVRALRRAGVDARIVVSDDDDGPRMSGVALGRWTEHGGVPVWFIPRVPARQRTLIGFTFAPQFVGWCQRHLLEFDFIHVHTVFSFPANVGMWVARWRGIPFAVRPLGQLCEWALRQRGWGKRLQLALFSRANVDRAAFLHVTTALEAEESARTGCRCPVLVQPHGLDLPVRQADARARLRVDLGVPADRLLVLTLSRLHPVKGLEGLLQAVAQQRDRAFDLVIAGTGEPSYVAQLQALVGRLGLTGRVHWVGQVDGERKWRCFQGSDVFVLASHMENFGMVVLEALAAALPVVVSAKVGLAEEVRRHRVGRVAELEPGAFATALDELLGAEAERRAIASRAPQVVAEHFSWDAAARGLIASYEAACGRPGKII
ncbi:MAG: glycosyltransferase [Verrucomicrobia bacterium]|nr:glycosyltransferase [Verrucomicrobiota bacterium]